MFILLVKKALDFTVAPTVPTQQNKDFVLIKVSEIGDLMFTHLFFTPEVGSSASEGSNYFKHIPCSCKLHPVQIESSAEKLLTFFFCVDQSLLQLKKTLFGDVDVG